MWISPVALQVALRHGGACDRCTALARLLIATPCAHLLCVGCAGGDRRASCAVLSCAVTLPSGDTCANGISQSAHCIRRKDMHPDSVEGSTLTTSPSGLHPADL